jgi:hypothetical protein
MNKFAVFIMFCFGYALGHYTKKEFNDKMENLIKKE